MKSAHSNVILGIDLGTTNSAVGLIDSGFPILLADENGDRLTPSVVWFPGEDATPVVGKVAERAEPAAPDRVVRSVKRRMGEVGTFRVGTEAAGGGMDLTPEAVSAEILKKMRAIAEAAQGETVTRAVITVPAYFNDGQRNATKRAAEIAGLDVERIINEPTAAALAYGLDKLEERSRIAVYDFGGGTFDVSILELNSGVFQVLATHGDTELGGDDLDIAIGSWIAAKIFEETGVRTDPAHQREIVEAALRAKIELSDKGSTSLKFPFLPDHGALEIELSRDEFETIIREFLQRTAVCCRRALSDSGLDPTEIDEVILVGGSTRIPAVRRMVEEVFGRKPNTSQNPDEAIAAGAVIQAGILAGSIQNVVLLDVTPLSLGIETFGGLMNVIIPRNTTIPAKAGELFTNAVAGQESLLVRVIQGERELAKDNWVLGEFTVPFEPGPKGSARVGVQFRIDENGILEILTRDQERNVDRIFEIRDVVIDVEDSAVEAMIEESVEFAFEDLAERKNVELRLKAEELLRSVDIALEKLGNDIDPDARERLLAAASGTRRILEQGEGERLREAVEDLEAASDPVATMLLERLLDPEGS